MIQVKTLLNLDAKRSPERIDHTSDSDYIL